LTADELSAFELPHVFPSIRNSKNVFINVFRPSLLFVARKPETPLLRLNAMVLVPVALAYVRQLQPDRFAIFNFSDDVAWRVRQAGFGFVIVEGQGKKKILAVGRKDDLVGKARAWNVALTSAMEFVPESAFTAGGWFARAGGGHQGLRRA
jgi:hypothetical protein